MRLFFPADGIAVTTSGSWALRSDRSIAAYNPTREPLLILGAEITRRAAPPQIGHPADSGAVPSGHIASNRPSVSHRYS